jgi:hypothetical protein
VLPLQCAIIVATVRALKMHGGGPDVVAGKPLDFVYKEEALDLVAKGCENLLHHINNINKFGVKAVVAINKFSTDTDAEINLVKELAMKNGAYAAVVANHWAEGGLGAVDLGHAVSDACRAAKKECTFKFLYPLEMSLKDKIATICKEMYGADDVEYSELAEHRLQVKFVSPLILSPPFLHLSFAELHGSWLWNITHLHGQDSILLEYRSDEKGCPEGLHHRCTRCPCRSGCRLYLSYLRRHYDRSWSAHSSWFL